MLSGVIESTWFGLLAFGAVVPVAVYGGVRLMRQHQRWSVLRTWWRDFVACAPAQRFKFFQTKTQPLKQLIEVGGIEDAVWALLAERALTPQERATFVDPAVPVVPDDYDVVASTIALAAVSGSFPDHVLLSTTPRQRPRTQEVQRRAKVAALQPTQADIEEQIRQERAAIEQRNARINQQLQERKNGADQ